MKSSTISLAYEVFNGLVELFLLLTEVSVFPNYSSLLFHHFSVFRMKEDVIIFDFRIVFKVLENQRIKRKVTVFFFWGSQAQDSCRSIDLQATNQHLMYWNSGTTDTLHMFSLFRPEIAALYFRKIPLSQWLLIRTNPRLFFLILSFYSTLIW